MGCFRHLHNNAISEVLGALLVLIIITLSVSATLVWVVPYIDSSKVDAQTDNVYFQFFILDEVLNTLINQGKNSSSYSNVMIEKGNVDLDLVGNRIVIYYSIDSNYDFDVSDLEYNTNSFYVETTTSPGNFDCEIQVIKIDDDITESLTVQTLNPGATFDTSTASFEISDNIKMELIDDGTSITFGYIWIFDVGAIKHSLSSNDGENQVIVENMGVLTSYGTGLYLKKLSHNFLFNEADNVVLNIVKLQSWDSSLSSGGHTEIKIQAKNNDTYIRQFNTKTYNALNIIFYGETSNAWTSSHYFTNNFNTKSFDGKDILYIAGDKNLTIVQNVLDVKIGVI